MANQRKAPRRGSQSSTTVRMLRFGAIPLLVVLLIIIIMAADRQGEEADASFAETSSGTGQTQEENADETADSSGDVFESQSEEEAENGDLLKESGEKQPEENGESGETKNSLELQDPSQYPLLQDTMLELTGLVRLYCEAKKECDPDLLARVFGIEDWSEEKKEEERAAMELVKASIKSYENISCYLIQGPEEESYVIFPYYEIRYRQTETLMPAISWAYVRRTEGGEYYMAAETDETINKYIRQVGEKPEVKAVLAQVHMRQQEAIASDEVLQQIYGSDGESEVIVGGDAG